MDKRASSNNKGKATADERGPYEETHGESSIVSRITASAYGLAKESIGRSSAWEASGVIASGSGGSSKLPTFASHNHESGWAETLPARLGAVSTEDSSLRDGAFRTGSDLCDASIRLETRSDLDDFLHTNNVDYQSSLRTTQQNFRNTEELQPPRGAGGHCLVATAWNGNSVESSGPAEMWFDDGAEVRRLLSSPALTAGTHPPSTQMDSLTEDAASDLRVQPGHTAEAVGLDANLLGGDKSNIDFTTVNQHEHWLTDWEGVFNGYTDEVWRELLPSVQAARAQLQDARADTRVLSGRTAARLRMTMGHMVESANLSSAEPRIATINHQDRRHIQEEARENKRKITVPIFHCPWISCHEVSRPTHQVVLIKLDFVSASVDVITDIRDSDSTTQ